MASSLRQPRQRGSAPSVPAVVFILIAVLVPLGLQQPLLNADGDPARHLTHGLYMLAHGGLISRDPFSFTRGGEPFLGFEYGSQLAYALAYRIGGLPAVAILAGILIASAYALLARLLLRWGVDPLLAYVTTALAAALGAGHWVARPHLVTLVAVVILMGLLEREDRVPAWLFALLFAVWANLHGGFVFGWVLIALYLVGSLTETLAGTDRPAWSARSRHLAVVLPVCLLAPLLNPHGVALLTHVIGYFGLRFTQDNTAELLSPDFHEIDGRIYLCAIALTLLGLALVRRRPPFTVLFTMIVTLAFGLIAVRNVALFGLTALPLLARHVDPEWRRLPDPRGLRAGFAATARSATTLPWVAPALVALAALAAAHGRVAGRQVLEQGFDSASFPVAAVARARAERVHGRIFNEFVWGGYLIFAWPEQPIFIDGGTDFFGEELFREYSRVKQLAPGWRDVLRRWNIDLALLRPASALAHQLSREGGYRLWYCDSVAVLFQRSGEGSSPTREAADSSEDALRRCSAIAHSARLAKPPDPSYTGDPVPAGSLASRRPAPRLSTTASAGRYTSPRK